MFSHFSALYSSLISHGEDYTNTSGWRTTFGECFLTIIMFSSQDHEATCEFMKVPCVYPVCGMLVKRCDLAHHLTTECRCRQAKCRFCNAEIRCNSMKVILC